MSSARESAMFGFTKLCAIVGGVSGIALIHAIFPLVAQAKGDWLIAQVPPLMPDSPALGGSSIPSNQATPSNQNRTILDRPTRRVPVAPFPMPGEIRPPLPPLPATPDMRTMPQSEIYTQSGISGRVTFTPICSVVSPASTCVTRPYTGTLKISTASRNRTYRIIPDAQGNFRMRLLPEMYVIEPDEPNFPIGTRQTFTVISNVMRQMEFNFQGATQR